jgi:hypothetical protein
MVLSTGIGLLLTYPKILKHYTTYRIHIYKYSEKFLDYIYNEDYSWLFLSRKYIKYYEYKKNKYEKSIR